MYKRQGLSVIINRAAAAKADAVSYLRSHKLPKRVRATKKMALVTDTDQRVAVPYKASKRQKISAVKSDFLLPLHFLYRP